MRAERLPVLTEGGSSLDWASARYEAKVDIKGSQAIIVHYLDGAPQLDQLLGSGHAKWLTEFRCPRTLHSREVWDQERTQRVTWNEDDVVGQTFLLSGLVAVSDLELDPTGLNPFGWSADKPIEVPAGWWLVRAEARRVEPLVASLVRFREDKIEPGQMSVDEDTDGGNPCFVVRMASDLYEKRRDDRDIQIAGLIGAFARLPRSSMGRDSSGLEGENYDHVLAQELRRRLEEAEIPDWESEQFDSIQAATWLEAFYVGAAEEDE
ncbi:MAG: hypothetical protein F4X48_00310 [Acidimicrobiia bacterium]|nr:hypothetical protein [Acidimicrobiia bacterium]MYC57024.1 hypothetical protein [Acidimicrobiia bacterium]